MTAPTDLHNSETTLVEEQLFRCAWNVSSLCGIAQWAQLFVFLMLVAHFA